MSCQMCGVLLKVKPRGRKKQRCPDCAKKHRKEYDARHWLQVGQVKSAVRAVVPRQKGSRKEAFTLLEQYEKSALFKQTGSYSEPLPNSKPLLIPTAATVDSPRMFGKEYQEYLALKRDIEARALARQLQNMKLYLLALALPSLTVVSSVHRGNRVKFFND